MTYAKNLGPWKFNLDNKFIWKATDALKKLLPKFRHLNSYVKTNDHLGVQENVITDLSFRPHAHSPERVRRVFKGINQPVVIITSPAISVGLYGYNQFWLTGRSGFYPVLPFSILRGILRRDFLTIDSTLKQVEDVFSFKRDNYLSIVDSINNLKTYYEDNDNLDYDEAITMYQSWADHLIQSLVTLSTMRNEIAQNLIDLNNYQESDLDLNYSNQYNQVRDSLTYTNYNDYLESVYSSHSYSSILNLLSDLFNVNQTTYTDGFYPLQTDGSIDYQSNNVPFTSSSKRLFDVRYLGMGAVYEEEYVDPTLHIKGTPLNEDTKSIRNTTNGPVLATRIGSEITETNKDYVVGEEFRYNSFYVEIESINDYSNKLYFKNNFGNNQFETYDYNLIYFENRLHRGILYPNQGAIHPPHVTKNEFNYEVRPRILLCFEEAHENDTIFAGASMLFRKSIEVDHIYHSPYGTLNSSSGTATSYNFEEPWEEIESEYSNDEYVIKVNHLSPKETLNVISGQDDQFEVRHNELFFFRTINLGTRSTLIGNKLSEDYRTSNYLHHVDLEERLPRPVINTLQVGLGNTGSYISNYRRNNYETYLSNDYTGGSYLHEHGRYHPNLGLHNLEDLFVSASHLGDRYDKDEWNVFDEELDKEAPLVVYRRGYSVLDHINAHLDYGNESSVTQNGNPGDYGGYTVTNIDFDEDTWDITNIYDSTSDIIWHGRNPDSPVEEPFLWLYKGQHRRKYVSLFENFRSDGTIANRQFVHKESIQNIYFFHKGYVKGPHTNNGGSYSYDFKNQVDTLRQYGNYALTWNGQYSVETLYAKYEGYNVYYDQNGNETYRYTFQGYEDSFDETPVEDIVNAIKNNDYSPIWDTSYTKNPFGLYLNDSSSFPWTDNFYSSGILVQGTSDRLRLYFKEKSDAEQTVCNINFEIDAPLSEQP